MALYIVTKDAHGNDRVFAGCRNYEATWTLQIDKMAVFHDFDLALSVARQFPDFRIVSAHEALGVCVRTSGAPHYNQLVI